MSSVTSNANLPDFNVYNTVVNESAVAAVLGPLNLDNLLFASACNPEDPITIGASNVALTLANYIQALVGQQQIYKTTTDAVAITVGDDTAANAAALQNIFGLTSANQTRILSFVGVLPANSTNSSTGPAGVLSIANSSTGPTQTYVQILALNGSATNTASLYATTTVTNGVVRRVAVFAPSNGFTAGSEVIQFKLLQ